MAGDKGAENSSEGGSQPLGSAVAGASRPVFISYASHDAPLAQNLCSTLEAADFPCWIAPRDVVPGTLYAEGIVRALDESRVLVLILSEQAMASAHVGRELERAVSKRHPIIALKVDSAPLTPAFEYFLNQSQWIEVGAGGADTAIAKLVEAVGRHLAAGSTAAQSFGPQATLSPRKAATSRRVWGIAAAVVVALGVAVGLGFYLWKSNHGAAQAPAVAAITDKSIAVLPFVDMSEKKDQEYFADGMAEEIIDLLVRIPGLKVIGRTSSFQFKGKTEDLRNIGTRLGVAYVLEGSVRKSNERVRVTAQLIDTRTGVHLWSETYDRLTGDTLQVQDEIAIGLARALQTSVGADRQQSRRRPKSDEAYDLYLRGLHALGRNDIDGMATGVTYLQQALDIDPDFMDAAAALADTFYWQANSGIVSSQVGYDQARRAAESVLSRDPDQGLARAVLGAIHSDYDRDWTGADWEFKKALAQAPRDGEVLMLSAQLPVALGQLDVARRIYQQSLAYDPLSATTYFFLSWVEFRARKWPEAEAAARNAVDIAPAIVWGHAQLCFVLLMRGEREAALAEAGRETDPMIRQQAFAIAYHALGRKTDSDLALKALISEGADREAFQIASVYGYRGEQDEALKWLDRAYQQRDPNLFFVKSNPLLGSLEGDPRYKAFLNKMNLPND
jgi:TolB-like protein